MLTLNILKRKEGRRILHPKSKYNILLLERIGELRQEKEGGRRRPKKKIKKDCILFSPQL